MQKTAMTINGELALREELEHLIKVVRPSIVDAIATAVAMASTILGRTTLIKCSNSSLSANSPFMVIAVFCINEYLHATLANFSPECLHQTPEPHRPHYRQP